MPPRDFLSPQQLLQANDIGGEAVDFLLRFVDGRETRHHIDEGLVGFLEAFIQALVDLAADFRQSRIG